MKAKQYKKNCFLYIVRSNPNSHTKWIHFISICINIFSIKSDESFSLDKARYCYRKLKGILGGALKMTVITKVQTSGGDVWTRQWSNRT